jgi:hypothetical protein
MNSVGGYFELELKHSDDNYHVGAMLLNTGRNCLEHILRCKNYKKIYLPYFTCSVLLEAIKKIDIDVDFYHIHSDFYPMLSKIELDTVILYTNYFGLMNGNIEILTTKYRNLIIDNAQAFYDKPVNNFPTFYSPRKFFGLPDGGLVYNSTEIDTQFYPQDISGDRISHLITRIEQGAEEGFVQYKRNENLLANQPIKRMSKLTQLLMQSIDYEKIKTIRNENFNYLHESLKTKCLQHSLVLRNGQANTLRLYLTS